MSQSDGRPWSFARFLKLGFIFALVGYIPLQLYILFGPSDGNPIRLGLLLVVWMLAGLFVSVIGFVKMLLQFFTNRDG